MGAKDVPQVDNHVLLLSENGRRIVVDARTYIREVKNLKCFQTPITSHDPPLPRSLFCFPKDNQKILGTVWR